MATTTAKKKSSKPKVQVDSQGQPDIVALKESGMTMKQAAEAAGVSFPQAHVLMYRQEVEHNPDLRINAKSKTLGKQLAALREQGVRWERLAARTGLSRAECIAKVAEHLGVDPADLKRAPADPKAKSKAKKDAAKKGKAKQAEEIIEQDEEDLEDEDEELEDEDTEDEDDSDDSDEDDEDDDDDDEDEEEELPPPPAAKKRRK